MANSKISALTSATTPLAGTEVLPVVQSGATTQVSVANLTVGRAVSALSFASTTGASFATTSGNVGVGTSSGIAKLSNTSTAWAGGNATDGFLWRSTQNDWTATVLATPAAGAGYGLRLHTLGATTSDYPLYISSGATAGTLKFSVQGDGTTTFTGGNLVQGTAAKGINFTANTATAGSTSRLLNWYEEGTWTPDLLIAGGNTGVTYTSRSGRYTRNGRLVQVECSVVLSSKGARTGGVRIGGLPFTPGIDILPATVVPTGTWAGLTAGGSIQAYVSGTAVYFLLGTTTSTAALTDVNLSNTSAFTFTATFSV